VTGGAVTAAALTPADSLEGRVALVTGGGRGIGRAIAQELVRRGARVVVADNGTDIAGRGADATVAAEAAAALGGAGEPFAESVADPAGARAAVELAVARFGGLDLVVNNAAILRDAFVFKGDPADFDAVVRTNLSAAYYVLAAATPLLREQARAGRGGAPYGWGRVVNVVSTAGLYGNYGQAAYASAKAGLVGLTRVVALDMARSGVTCNAVAPFAATRVTGSIVPANEGQAAYKRRALAVPAWPVAAFVAYLCSPAARGVTGQLFAVRGRELFLFGQPRPVARLVTGPGWGAAELAAAVDAELAGRFADPSTDLEAFNTDPVV
jgi:NAD(P)-dependent dehydrogenase (short-subunit alcohol dehydrogenase family)